MSPRSEDSFALYLSTMPWLAVPWEQEERRRELAALLGVQGIPTLVLLDADGSVITADGRGEVNEDPLGEVSHSDSNRFCPRILVGRLNTAPQGTPYLCRVSPGRDYAHSYTDWTAV